MKGGVLGSWVNEEKERRGEEMNLKGREDQNGAKPSVQGNTKRDVGEFKFKDSAPTVTRWGRPTPRFGHPPLGSTGLQILRVGF